MLVTNISILNDFIAGPKNKCTNIMTCGLFLLVMLLVGVCYALVSIPCSLVVTCWERADLLAVVFVVFCHFPKCALVHIRIKGEVGAVNPV